MDWHQEKAEKAMLVLENEEETRHSFISTAKGMGGAMCTGTFLPEDNRDTRTIRTKDGLDGEYTVKLIVEDKKYETGVTIRV